MSPVEAVALEAKLRAHLGAALDARLAALRAETGGLFDREALVLMLADEEGLLPVQAVLDVGAGPPAVVEVVGVLERLTPTRPFRRADGTTGFVADADVRTALALVRVVLWDEAVRRAQGLQGRRVRLTGLAERPRPAGAELHATRDTEVGPA